MLLLVVRAQRFGRLGVDHDAVVALLIPREFLMGWDPVLGDKRNSWVDTVLVYFDHFMYLLLVDIVLIFTKENREHEGGTMVESRFDSNLPIKLSYDVVRDYQP